MLLGSAADGKRGSQVLPSGLSLVSYAFTSASTVVTVSMPNLDITDGRQVLNVI
jgi:hypothetical protein